MAGMRGTYLRRFSMTSEWVGQGDGPVRELATPAVARAQVRRLLALARAVGDRQIRRRLNGQAFKLAQFAAIAEEQNMVPPPAPFIGRRP